MLGYLKDRVKRCIEGWKLKKLSRPAKEILVKTVAQSLPVFAMSVFLLPMKITRDIEKLLARFWWNISQSSNHSIIWMAWDRMSLHKHMGGLSFRNFRDFNIAMLGKQCWRLCTNSHSLSTQIYKARYYKDTSFMEAKLGGSPSFIWRSLLEARDVILAGARWRVGTGELISIVGQPWLGTKGDAFVSTSSPSIRNEKVSSLMCTGTRTWDWEVITDIFNDEDCERIQNTMIEGELQKDVLVWDHDITGVYTVKSAYKLLQVQKGAWDNGNCTGVWKALWKIKAPQKALNLLWRALTHCLPTKTQLLLKRVQVEARCDVCKSGNENIAHIFVHCPFAERCWEIIHQM